MYDVEKERVIHSRNVVLRSPGLGIAEMEQKVPEKRLVEFEKPDPEDDCDKEEENELNSEKHRSDSNFRG